MLARERMKQSWIFVGWASIIHSLRTATPIGRVPTQGSCRGGHEVCLPWSVMIVLPAIQNENCSGVSSTGGEDRKWSGITISVMACKTVFPSHSNRVERYRRKKIESCSHSVLRNLQAVNVYSKIILAPIRSWEFPLHPWARGIDFLETRPVNRRNWAGNCAPYFASIIAE